MPNDSYEILYIVFGVRNLRIIYQADLNLLMNLMHFVVTDIYNLKMPGPVLVNIMQRYVYLVGWVESFYLTAQPILQRFVQHFQQNLALHIRVGSKTT